MIFLSTKVGRSLYYTAFESDDTLVFDNERSGLPEPFYERYRDSLVRIPMPGQHAREPQSRQCGSGCALRGVQADCLNC